MQPPAPKPRRYADLGSVLTEVERLQGDVASLQGTMRTLLKYVQRTRQAVDRMSLPPGSTEHPDFAVDAPLWVLELYRDGRPTRSWFPINASTACGMLIPTRYPVDALRFGTRAEAERFAAQDRRFAAYRVVPDPVERDEPDDDDAPRLFR